MSVPGRRPARRERRRGPVPRPGAPGPGARGLRPGGRARRDRGPDRPERLRQEHVPAGRGGPADADGGDGHPRRPADRRPGPPDRAGLPGAAPPAVAVGRRQHHLPAGARRVAARAESRPAGGAAAAGRPRRGDDRPPEPALRRHAPAGGDRPGARPRAGGAAARRAVQRARRADPRPVQPRAARSLGADRLDGRDRHPQHPRGDPARRPGRRDDAPAGPRRRDRPDRRPSPALARPPRPAVVSDAAAEIRAHLDDGREAA